jgi:putative methyltransferase (TIGR04325 family)
MTTLQELSDKIQSVPILKSILERYYERVFSTTGSGMFRGVYSSFKEAAAAAPTTKKLGFDHQESSRLYDDRLTHIFPEDYPVLFWLCPILEPGCRVFDFGGHRGNHFYSYAGYINYPLDLSWTVCDVAAVVEAGKELARQKNKAGQLNFTTDFQAGAGATVFLAAGSLHYVESPPFPEALACLHAKPKHLILNKLPLYNGKPYVTLQNGKVAFHPLYVYNRAAFVTALNNLGYDLIDEWVVPTRHGRIPFHAEVSFPTYTGLYLRLRG